MRKRYAPQQYTVSCNVWKSSLQEAPAFPCMPLPSPPHPHARPRPQPVHPQEYKNANHEPKLAIALADFVAVGSFVTRDALPDP